MAPLIETSGIGKSIETESMVVVPRGGAGGGEGVLNDNGVSLGAMKNVLKVGTGDGRATQSMC